LSPYAYILGVSLLEARLWDAFTQKAFPQSPSFAFEYDEADIDWTTGSVKIPRMKDRFRPTFLKADFNAYFFEDQMASETSNSNPSLPSRKVFVVHGRDNDAKNEVARFLSKIGLEEIILHERPNRGRHLLTKFQEESEGAGFAVVLITPDDEGALIGEPPRKRARQNVVFELGFFIGKLGPANVAALVKGDVDKPSDFDGIGYIPLDAAGRWKSLLARELKDAGVPFDPAKALDA
jgi:predicted nucleotide-binding protein